MKAEILKNVFLNHNTCLLKLEVPSCFKKSHPGQFIHLRVEDSCDPLLRRPLSIHGIEVSKKTRKKCILKILYHVIGKGTKLLSQKGVGARVDLIGPLGNGFEKNILPQAEEKIIIAGGMGVAPLLFLAEKFILGSRLKKRAKPLVLIGAGSKKDLLCEREFKKLGCRVLLATEDGTKGYRGRVTDLLERTLQSTKIDDRATLFSCGPKPMLAAVAKMAGRYSLAAYVSLEEFMGCGLGACLGCVLPTQKGYQRVCHDGPVFNADQVLWGKVC